MAIRERGPRTREKGRPASIPIPEQPCGVHTPSGHEAGLDTLKARVETLEGENDILKRQLSQRDAQLSAAQARAEMQAVEIAVRDAQYAADLAAERGKTEKAITDYMALLAKFAAKREGRPWWRRIVRAG